MRFRQQYLGVGFVSGRQEPNGPPAGRMTILAVNHLPGVSPRIKGALLRTIAVADSDERGTKMAANTMPSAGGRMPAAFGADDLFHLFPSMVQAQSAAASIGSLINAKTRARDLFGRSDYFS